MKGKFSCRQLILLSYFQHVHFLSCLIIEPSVVIDAADDDSGFLTIRCCIDSRRIPLKLYLFQPTPTHNQLV